MITGASFQHSTNRYSTKARTSRSTLCGVLACTLFFALAAIPAISQTTPSPRRGSAIQNASNIEESFPIPEAETLLSQGSVEEAKKKIQEQLVLNPSSVEGYNLLGIAYISEKDYPNALEAFQHALKIDPSSVKTANNLGNLYAAQEQFDLAETEFRKALHLDPNNSEGNYNLGLVLMAKGLPAQAITNFLRVRALRILLRVLT